jgi:tellurium resistance protein TerZ
MGIPAVAFGLGWDAGCDVDASVIALKAGGVLAATVYFGNKDAFDKAIHHRGDNTTGAGDGDDEVIDIKLDQIPSDVLHLFCVVNVYSGGDFSDVENEFVRIFDPAPGGKAIMRYGSLDSNGSYAGLVLGCLFRDDLCPGRWMFKAIGLGADGCTASSLVDECQALQKNGLDASSLRGDDDCCCVVM